MAGRPKASLSSLEGASKKPTIKKTQKGRPKKQSTSSIDSFKQLEELKEPDVMIQCVCGKTDRCSKSLLNLKSNFYITYSSIYAFYGRLPICKECIALILREETKKRQDIQLGLYFTCQQLNLPFILAAFDAALKESNFGQNGDNPSIEDTAIAVWKVYIKNINSLNQYKFLDFQASDRIDEQKVIDNIVAKISAKTTDVDKRNEQDCLKLIGYDPFTDELAEDRTFLFNSLIEYLSEESTVEDPTRLTSVIMLVKGFNQVRKIDGAIADINADPQSMLANAAMLKSFINMRNDAVKSTMLIAQDNGFTAKHNSAKSAGSSSLSGIIKKINEIGLDEAKVNSFDIRTSNAMLQVANLSSQAIIKQLNMTENEYAQIIATQRSLVEKLQKEKDTLEEENRLVKKQNQNIRKNVEERFGIKMSE